MTVTTAVRGNGEAGSPISDWRRQERAVMEGIITAEAQVAEGNGGTLPAMARVFLAALPMLRYISAVAVSQIHADSKC